MFENKVEEIALDVGIAIDNLTKNSDVDLLYMTSIGFFFIVMLALCTAFYSYKERKCLKLTHFSMFFSHFVMLLSTVMKAQPLKGQERPTAQAMARSLIGGNKHDKPNNPEEEEDKNNDDDVKSSRSVTEIAYDYLVSPMNIFKRDKQDGAEAAEISRLSLHYSSANLSEEESSSLINILDRKKYHEKLAATRSADDQIQPR